uniref:VWFA domain-containing protein n=1 Tax=Mola mola TaxID=94237 RepID=A0A3Q4AE78_MOLML
MRLEHWRYKRLSRPIRRFPLPHKEWLTNCFFVCVLRIKEWVDQMQKELITLIDTASGMHHLIWIYRNHSPHFTVESNNARDLVATAAGNIERLLANRSEALKRLAAEAEKFQMEHEWRDDSELNQTKRKTNRYVPEDFEIDPDFKRLVSYNTTAVHIPTDIYEGSTIILNELNWTEALEDVFRKNKEEDPSLLWQVFGSATGLARYYPASPWMNSMQTFLVFLSGSVSGLTLKLIRTSVSKMLETLSDDDYVNVVYFNDKAMYASCFENLVQANVRNKRMLKKAVQGITAKGITNYRGGFELAFKQLAQMNVSRANCNKIIMLFTDGGEEKAEEIFKKYNPNQAVRIFTFSVGQHNYDKGPIQWMACTNKGYYYEIPSIGAIRINTQEYLDVLGRPMVKDHKRAKQVQWTNVYLDALELGLVITGTLPVFNKTNTGTKRNLKFQNQLILGVMAIDVSLEDIKRLTPRFTFGPNGYYFAIDPNGYVLLHPNLQPLFHEPVTLDFLDAELENDIKVEVWKVELLTYHAALIWDFIVCVCVCSLSLALVLPQYSMHYIKANIDDTITQAKFSESLLADKFDEYGYTFIAPRMYCKDLKPDKNKNNTEFLMEFNDYIDTKTPNNPSCNVELVNRMLLDAGITSELIKIWKKNEVRFVATDGGITRVYPKSAGLSWEEEAETYESSFYKRSLDNDLYVFTPSPYSKENCDDESVLVSRAVNIDVSNIILKPAVVGVKLDISAWMASFINTTQRMNCNDEICGCQRNHPYVECVLLDDGGFLVMSNQDDDIAKIGRFFGVIDPILMKTLVNSSLFTFKKTFDYQSLCDPKKESKAAAGLRSVYVPTIADILNLGWWATAAMLDSCIRCMFYFFYLNVLMRPSAAEMDDEVSDAMLKEVCITEQTQYYFESNQLSFRGNIDCENCTRAICCCCYYVRITGNVPDFPHPADGPDPCELAHNPRHRKGPDVCLDSTQNVSCSYRTCRGFIACLLN